MDFFIDISNQLYQLLIKQVQIFQKLCSLQDCHVKPFYTEFNTIWITLEIASIHS